MTTTDPRVVPALPPDPGLTGVRGLFRDGGADLLAQFLHPRGWSVVESRPVQASYQPGRSCTLRYRVRALNPDGQPRVLTLSAETRHRPGRVIDPPEAFADRYGLPDPVERIGPHLVWAYPYDPSLEGLADAAWGPVVRERLEAAGRPLRAIAVQPLRYRPRRRAVFRYTGLHGGRAASAPEALYGKVLRRSKHGRWTKIGAARQRRIRVAMPLGGADASSLLFAPLEGRSLRDLLLSGGSLPSPERVARLVDDVPRALTTPGGERDRLKPLRNAMAIADLIARLSPAAQPSIARLLGVVAEGVDADDLPSRTIHGDLYEAQVFVGPDYSLGLIDLDDAGPGDPAMDAANFSAHLVALALAVPRVRKRLMAYRALVREAFLDRLDLPSRALAWREALSMTALATGPFRVLSPRWPDEVRRRADLAIRLVEAA